MEGNLEMGKLLNNEIVDPSDLHLHFQTTEYADRPSRTGPDTTPPQVKHPAKLLKIFTLRSDSIQVNQVNQQGLDWLNLSDARPCCRLADHNTEFLDEDGPDNTTPSGRPVTQEHSDILLTHTPDPLHPYYDPQTHYCGLVGNWWLTNRTGLAVGSYRFKVYGNHYMDHWH